MQQNHYCHIQEVLIIKVKVIIMNFNLSLSNSRLVLEF